MPDPLFTRRARVAAALPLGDAVLLVGAGEPVPLPENSDQTYPFRAHADYVYLSGQDEAGGVMAFDPQGTSGADGGWKHFVRPASEAERIWEGRQAASGLPLDHLDAWLHARRSRPFVCLGAPIDRFTIDSDPGLTPKVRTALTHARRPKDAVELDLIGRAVAATTRGYHRLPGIIRPGVSERAVQVELEAEFFRAGGRRTGYGSIVGSGPNSAVLHFEPSGRVINPGEFVLVDAGAEVDRYVADVTRTYVAGTPTGLQRDLHAAVLHAEQRAIARCVVGAEWKANHLSAALDLIASLVELKILRGQPDSLLEREAHTLFFPHGLGHMVGLGVRDASGLAPGRTKDPRASLRTLRMDLPLQAGYVVTVEPGLYFIRPLLQDPSRRERFRDAVNWPFVDTLLDLGGVRIEDNVLVTPAGPQVLTSGIPHTLDGA